MRVCHTLICFFFLSLRDGNTGLIDAEIRFIRGKEGGNITYGCSFTFSGRRKIFCKGKCEEKDILIETTGDRAQSGRYSIIYDKGDLLSRSRLNVSITNLTQSDSGRYRCSLARDWLPDSKEEFEIRVEDAPVTLKPNSVTHRPFSTSVPSASTTTITQSLNFSSGSCTPSSASPETTNQSEQQQTTSAAGPATGPLLYVGLTLVVMIIVLSVAVLIFSRNRARKPKDPPVDAEYADATEASRVYEEVREEAGRSRPPPVEISTVYTSVKYNKPNTVKTSDVYSFTTAASSEKKTEDASNKLIYSEVNFSNGADASLNSAPRGDADNVVYSVPRVEASSDGGHAEDTSPPLYSTVNLNQR